MLIVEDPKAPDDAVWKVDESIETCVSLKAVNLPGMTLQIDGVPGRVEMRPSAPAGLACLRMQETLPPLVEESKCKANDVSDAVKVASMADGQPCRLIPYKKCGAELPGSVLGEHALCKTKSIERDLKAKECLVYGIGISDNWDFEKAMAQKGCEVHAFDPTIRKPPTDESKRLPNLHFHRWGLAGRQRKVEPTRLLAQSLELLHYGKELMLDSQEQLKRAARVTDMLRSHNFAEWRNDWRDGYESHRQLLPELYEAGMPGNMCCRLSGFMRMEKKEL